MSPIAARKCLRRGTRLQREASPEFSAHTSPTHTQWIPEHAEQVRPGGSPTFHFSLVTEWHRSSLATRPQRNGNSSASESWCAVSVASRRLVFNLPAPPQLKFAPHSMPPLPHPNFPTTRSASALGLEDHSGVPGSSVHKHTH